MCQHDMCPTRKTRSKTTSKDKNHDNKKSGAKTCNQMWKDNNQS